MATLTAGNSATFTLGTFQTLNIKSGGKGTLSFTSSSEIAQPSFTANVANGNFGPYNVSMSVVMTMTSGSADYTLVGNSDVTAQTDSVTGGINIYSNSARVNMTFPLSNGQNGTPILLVGAGSFNTTGLLTLTNAMSYASFPFNAKVYIAASNGLTAGVYACSVISTTAIQLAAPFNVTTSGAYASTTAEVILASVQLPAHSIGANGKMLVRHVWGMTNSGTAKTAKVKLATNEIANISVTGVAGYSGYCDIWNAGVETSQWQRATGAGSAGISTTTQVPVSASVDTSVDQVIYFTGTLGATTEFLTLHAYSIEISYLN